MAAVSVGLSPATPAEQQLAVAHRALLHAKGLQLDFVTAAQPKVPGWVQALLKALSGLGPVFKVVFWGGLAVGAAVIAWLVVREIMAQRRRPKAARAPEAWRPDAATARALLADADRLAGEGRYDEAVRVLLFRSIDDLAGRRPGTVRPALTSRDIAALDVMPQRARAAFSRIAEAVERSLFAGRGAGAEDFRRARADYEAYALAESWS